VNKVGKTINSHKRDSPLSSSRPACDVIARLRFIPAWGLSSI